MKKIFKVLSTAALLVTLGIPMTACSTKNTEKISYLSEYDVTYSTALHKGNWTINSDTSHVDFLDFDGENTVVVREAKNLAFDSEAIYSYRLLNLTTGAFVNGINSENALHVLDKGLFYSVKTTDNNGEPLPNDKDYTYTLYSASAVLISNVKGSIQNGVFTQENGTRWYVDYTGAVKEETNPFAMVFTDYDLHIGGKYIQIANSGNFDLHIYDKNGAFEKVFSLYNELNLSQDAVVVSAWTAGDTMFAQVETALPEDEDDYDYTRQDVYGVHKYELNTYAYSAKSDKIVEVADFEYYVENFNAIDGITTDYAILTVREIVNQHLHSSTMIQAFDRNARVYFDIQALVPGAKDMQCYGEFIVLKDAINMTHIYKEKDLILTIPADTVTVNFTKGNKMYYLINSMLYIYDLDSKSVVKTVANVSSAGTTQQGNIWYTVYDSTNITMQYNVYDINSGAVSLVSTVTDEDYLAGGNYGGTFCLVANEYNGACTLSFADCDIKSISSDAGISVVTEYTTSDDNTTYSVFCVNTKNENTSITQTYYVLQQTRSITEK